MNVLDLLQGKTVMVETDMKVIVELKIKSVEELEGRGQDYAELSYMVNFENGAKKEYFKISDINFH